MLKVVARPLAREDLKQISRYSFDERGEGQADKYFAEIEAGILKRQAHPHPGKSREDPRAGYSALRVNQHVINYMLTPSSIRIVRVLHARMDPHQNL
jgi:toxin ParE1/3/4